jgi:putative aldouronate transport system permease protein
MAAINLGRVDAPRHPGLRRRHRRQRETQGDLLVLVGIYAFLLFVAVVIVFPLLYIVAASFSSAAAVIEGRVWIWPVHPTLAAYTAVFQYPGIWIAYLNSIIYTVLGTILSVSLSVMMGYPLSRPDLYGKRFLVWTLLIAFLFTGGVIPTYLIVKALGMLDTRMSQIIPGALSIFSVILARSFFQTTIPEELIEAAEVDGASALMVLWKVVLPMSKPVLAVLALIFAVGQWNSYFYALIFLNSQNLFPLQLVLREALVLNELSASAMTNLTPEQLAHFQDLATLMKYSLIIVGSLPMLVLYPLAQRYFVKGLRLGSLK